MKKRILCMLLALIMLASTLQLPTAAATKEYGTFPILTGYADVDYMAEEILSEIDLRGKNSREQIRAVYDWIILHCERYEWDGTLYFDEETVQTKAEDYYTASRALIAAGDAVIRMDLVDESGLDVSGTFSDSNYALSYMAYDMMLKRTGHCGNFSALLAVLLGHLGFDCRQVAGDFVNNDGSIVEHQWNYVLLDGQYYWLDVRMDHATYKRIGTVPHDYFLISSTSAWDRSHNWDQTYTNYLAANASSVAALYESMAHPHTTKPVAATEPTCTEPGNFPYYTCTICGHCFLDKDALEPTTPSAVRIPALNHDWDSWIVIRDSTHESCGLWERHCRRDASHTDTYQPKALGNPFDDVMAGSFCETPVVWAVDHDITTGVSEQSFSPKTGCTRGQVVTFLWRTAGKPQPASSSHNFTDVPADRFYYDAVLWAVENAITTGKTVTSFAPDATCTRAEVVTFLWRAAGEPQPASDSHSFTDVQADKYYYKAMLWAVENAITTGKTTTTFAPNATCTRDEVVTFLYRAYAP